MGASAADAWLHAGPMEHDGARPRARTTRGTWTSWAGALAVVLLTSACGSTVSEDRLRAANEGAAPAAEDLGALDVRPSEASSSPARTSSGAAPSASRPGSASVRSPGGMATAGPGAGAAAGSGAGGGASSGDAAGEIVVGSFGTGSGIIGAQLAAIPVAVRAWMEDVNARGGVGGRPVRVIFGDDGGDPGRAVAIARRMVEEQGAVAFVGTYASTTIQAVTPYLEEHRIPLIGNSGSPTDDQSPMVFNPQTSNLGLHRSLVTTLVAQTEIRRAAFLSCREAETCRVAAQRVKAYAPERGVELVYEAEVSIAQPDYTAEMIAARNAGAEAVIAFIDGNAMKRIVDSAHRQGWRPTFVGGVSVNEESFKQGSTDIEGVLAVSSTAPYSSSPKMADYVESVQRYVPGGAIGGTGGAAWVAGKLFELVVERIEGEVTSAAILDGLLGLRGETVGGRVPPLTYPDGPHGEVNLCTVPLRFSGDRFVAPFGDRFECSR